MHLSSTARRLAVGLATVAMGAGTLVAAAPAAMAAPTTKIEPQVGFLAQAYGTYLYTADKTLDSGATAYSEISCTAEAGRQDSNNTAEVDLKKLGQIGATQTKAWSEENGSERSSLASSDTAKVNLLNGAITAEGLTATAKATWDGSDFKNESTSKLADLRVLGVPVKANAGPNTKVELKLPGVGLVGRVTVNQQDVSHKGGIYDVATAALHVELLKDVKVLGVKAGTDLWVGRARTQLTEPKIGYFQGNGFSTEVTLLDGTVKSGQTARSFLSCAGGKGKNNIAGADVPGLLKAGALETTTEATDDGNQAVGEVINTTGGVNVLDGLLEVEAIKTQANATLDGATGEFDLNTDGSKLVGVKVRGEEVAEGKLGENSKLKVGPIEVTFNKIVKSKTSVENTSIVVEIKKDGLGNLPVGSKIRIGYAKAGFNPAVSS